MNKKRGYFLISIILTGLFMSTFFYGCKKAATVVKTPEQTITYNVGSEPKTIDVSLNNASDANKVVSACFEGLTVIDPTNMVVPGVAKSWDISTDGLTYTFHLRDNAKWSDGKKVTADDFYFSWMRLLNPKTAADYSYQAFYLKNAQEYYGGKAKASEVGLKVIDPLTFEVKLAAPTPYFLKLCAFINFAPLRKDIVDANPTGWATNASTYIGNGPFLLKEWKHKDSLTLVKNTNYWNASAIKLQKLIFTEVTDNTIALEGFEKGEIDVIDTVPTTEMPRLLGAKKVDISPAYATYYIELNTKRYPMSNIKFRQALSLALNRTGIVTSIMKGGQKPASAMVPFGSVEPNGKDFRASKSYAVLPASADLIKAKQLLTESKVDLTKTKIVYLYNSESAAHKKIAEAVQQMWKVIGVNVQLANEEWAVFQATKTAGNFDVARGGWNGDYLDPMTFLDMWTTGNGQNNPKYSNPKYDSLIASAKVEVNQTTRMKELHDAEDVLMSDLPIIPIYFYVSIKAVNPKVKGVYQLPTGGIYFDKAYVQ